MCSDFRKFNYANAEGYEYGAEFAANSRTILAQQGLGLDM